MVWGREDRIIRPEMGERMAKDLRRARLVLLEAVGHLPPEEAPEASLEPVLEFLEREVRRH
jgi:pimeloyl-ACP methyl ester carboxylesterase